MATPWTPRSRAPMNPRSSRFRARRIALAALVGFAAAAFAQTRAGPASPHREIYLYQGADRDKRLVEGAKKERQVLFYSTMTVADGKALATAFEQKYGVRVNHWRGSVEKIVSRALAEARARRHEADVFETSSHRIEALHRERLLEDFHTPVLRDIVPEAFPRGHRQLVASGEVAFFLTAYNNNIETLKSKGAPVEWKPLQPAFGQAAAVGLSRYAPHPHAALLFTEFVLSKEGQEILKSGNRVPTSRLVDSPLNKFRYEIVDPVLALDEGEKWDKLFSDLFLGGKAVKEGD